MEGLFLFIEQCFFDRIDPISSGMIAGLLTIVVLAINVLFRRWLSPGQMGLMWALVLVRLLLPVAPSSPLSFENLFVNERSEDSAPEALVANAYVVATKASPTLPAASDETAVAGHVDAWLESIFLAMPMMWFVGGIGGLMWTVANHGRFVRRVKNAPRCSDERILSLWHECCAAANVRWPGTIVAYDEVGQPAIMGILRRTLLLPSHAAQLSDGQLQMIMFHEIAHVRRWDIAANWMLVAVRTVHWWNPVYWLAASRFRSLREQACDAFVVQRMAGEPVQQYRDLLLQLAQQNSAAPVWRVMLPASILGFIPSTFRRLSFRGRLKALRLAGKRRSRCQKGAVVGLTLLLAACGLTSARSLEQSQTIVEWMSAAPPANVANQAKFWRSPAFTGPLVSRTYDIGKVLAHADKDSAFTDDPQLNVKAIVALLLPQTANDAEKRPEGATADNVENCKPTCEIDGTILTIVAPADQQEMIKRTLNAWEASGLGQLTVETRFLRSNKDLAQRIGIAWQYLQAFSNEQQNTLPEASCNDMPVVRAESRIDEYLPVAVCKLTETQTDKLLDIAQQDARTNVLYAPKVTVFNGQQAMIADYAQRPFVIGVHQVRGELATASQPNIVVIDEGTKILLRGTQTQDRKRIKLEARIDCSSLEDVSTASAKLDSGEVTIELPKVNRLGFDIATEVSDGQTLLVGCLSPDKSGYMWYCLLTSKNLDVAAASKAAAKSAAITFSQIVGFRW
jgi:beta-lactamase regulating signal transducer with metallopeptidase domain